MVQTQLIRVLPNDHFSLRLTFVSIYTKFSCFRLLLLYYLVRKSTTVSKINKSSEFSMSSMIIKSCLD
jgi:hypothetical protein